MRAADEIEDQAARWILRREEAGWSDEDQRALEAWLALSFRHKAEFWRLEAGWAEAGRLPEAMQLPPDDDGAGDAFEQGKGDGIADDAVQRGPQPARRWQSPRWPALGAIAASLLMMVAAGWLWLARAPDSTPDAPVRYATQVGQRGDLSLADGSKVDLNTDTVVRVEENGLQRLMWLDRGEAYFEVAHDPSRPFVIRAGARDVTVLGTRFLVRRTGSTVTVSVVEGRVRVAGGETAGRAPSLVISRGDIATADGPSTRIESGALDRIEAAMSWRDGVLRFDQTPLADAAREFNRYNRKQVILKGEGTAGLKVGGKFQSSNIEGFARSVGRVYGLSVEIDKKNVIISSN